MQHQMKNLYQLENELINAKVEMAVEKAIDRVIQQITGLRSDMLTLKGEFKSDIQAVKSELNTEAFKIRGVIGESENKLHKELHEFRENMGSRLLVVENCLKIRDDKNNKVNDLMLGYIFKAGWVVIGVVSTYLYMHFIH